MQFETIAVAVLALGVLVFLFARRRVITGLQAENAALGSRLHKLGEVAERQRREIDALMVTAQAERRARQMATLSSQPAKIVPRPPVPPMRIVARNMPKEESTRYDPGSGNTWEGTNLTIQNNENEQEARSRHASEWSGAGGSFDGGGASGDYGNSSSSSCDSSSSSSSDSGSSSSSDSGCSSSSSD